MARTPQLKTQWSCISPGCPEAGEGDTAKEADKAAERHTTTAKHATVVWSEPTLPVAVPGATRGS